MHSRLVLLVLLLTTLVPLARADDRITLLTLDGAETEPQPAAGQLLVLHFWATWCQTCVAEFRDLQDALSTCSEDQVRILLVNVGDDAEVIRAFVKHHDVRLPVLRDPKGKVWRQSDGRGLPLNLFWSDEIKRTEQGPRTREQWLSLLVSHGCSKALPRE